MLQPHPIWWIPHCHDMRLCPKGGNDICWYVLWVEFHAKRIKKIRRKQRADLLALCFEKQCSGEENYVLFWCLGLAFSFFTCRFNLFPNIITTRVDALITQSWCSGMTPAYHDFNSYWCSLWRSEIPVLDWWFELEGLNMIFAKKRFLAVPLDLAFGRAGRWKTCFCLHPFLDLPCQKSFFTCRSVDVCFYVGRFINSLKGFRDFPNCNVKRSEFESKYIECMGTWLQQKIDGMLFSWENDQVCVFGCYFSGKEAKKEDMDLWLI